MNTVQEINDAIAKGNEDGSIDTNLISDTFHDFGELYEHRFKLYISLCQALVHLSRESRKPVGESNWHLSDVSVWRSRLHADKTMYPGWFIMGVYKQLGKQISYHLPESYWLKTNFVETLPTAPAFDGHSSKDVLERLDILFRTIRSSGKSSN